MSLAEAQFERGGIPPVFDYAACFPEQDEKAEGIARTLMYFADKENYEVIHDRVGVHLKDELDLSPTQWAATEKVLVKKLGAISFTAGHKKTNPDCATAAQLRPGLLKDFHKQSFVSEDVIDAFGKEIFDLGRREYEILSVLNSNEGFISNNENSGMAREIINITEERVLPDSYDSAIEGLQKARLARLNSTGLKLQPMGFVATSYYDSHPEHKPDSIEFELKGKKATLALMNIINDLAVYPGPNGDIWLYPYSNSDPIKLDIVTQLGIGEESTAKRLYEAREFFKLIKIRFSGNGGKGEHMTNICLSAQGKEDLKKYHQSLISDEETALEHHVSRINEETEACINLARCLGEDDKADQLYAWWLGESLYDLNLTDLQTKLEGLRDTRESLVKSLQKVAALPSSEETQQAMAA